MVVPAVVTGSTTVFFNVATLPSTNGNCFRLAAKDDPRVSGWLVANMHAENFQRVVSDLVIGTVEILPIGDECCLIVDNRIPKAWLRDRPCSTCIPRPVRRLLRETYAESFKN
jgi:hypothetical protein